MALEQRLNVKLQQTLRITPQLKLAIKVLQLSRPELESMIADELCQNPTLEESAPEQSVAEIQATDPVQPAAEAPEALTAPTKEAEASNPSEVDWQEYMDRSGGDFHGSVGAGSDRDEARARLFDNATADDGGLSEALLDQIQLLQMSEDERRLATLIVHNMDEDGFLACSVEELAFLGTCSVQTVEDAREIVQELEPVGCGSLNLQDCLLFQLQLKGYEPDDYVRLVVQDHLADLEAQRYDAIAKMLGTTTDEIVTAHKIIRTLDPKPGRCESTDDTRYIQPDAYVVKVGDDFEIMLNDEGIPRLQVSPLYKEMADEKGKSDTKSYLQERLRAGTWLIRSIEQRQRTLRKVVESIVLFQRPFLTDGVEHLKPMVLKDVAENIEMHESTVSRATSGKYVHTPQGLFELKYFFTSGLNRNDGGSVSSESVKQRIQAMIASENPKKPFSDQYICDELKKENVDIARRTVAKYREGMGILPSSKRKRVAALD